MNAIRPTLLQRLNAASRQPPAPPAHAKPDRYGSGAVEIAIYPHATAEDRIRAAITLLAGTGLRITAEKED